MEVQRTRAMVMGLMECTVGAKETKGSAEAFRSFVEAAFPWSVHARGEMDQKMVEMMKKEAAKGPILVTPQSHSMKPLRSTLKKLSEPDAYKKRLLESVRRKS